MEKDKNFGLNENEYKLICDYMKGKIFDLSVARWRENIICTMKLMNEYDDMESQYDVILSDLIVKLNTLSAIEFLELIKVTIGLWSIWSDPEKSYEMLYRMTPSEKMNEILSQTKNQSLWKH